MPDRPSGAIAGAMKVVRRHLASLVAFNQLR